VPIKIGVVMDPIATIKIHKDTTFAMLLEAQNRGWEIHYMEQADLYWQDSQVYANTKILSVQDESSHWFDFKKTQTIPLSTLDVVLMRKDPPFDIQYIYTTYLLELAEQAGTLVVNKPQGLRDYNEKLSTAWFPQCCTPTLVTRNADQLRSFIKTHQEIVLKPLEGMGGKSVFLLRENDPNINVIIEDLGHDGTQYIMAQRYIPEITKTGDKRILLIDGEAVPYALARIPQPGDSRGNLAAGAKGVGVELTERDQWICQQVGPKLKEKGLLFAGIDVIGDYLTEINITSPTCIREIDNAFNLNISAQLFDIIENRTRSVSEATPSL